MVVLRDLLSDLNDIMEERYIIYKNNRRSNVPDDVQYWIFKNSDKRGYYFINFDEK